jgi:drug/metabolite transporter (DMT)-like permease
VGIVRVVALTSLAMVAFAANSLLCRVALKNTQVDAATFTTVRLLSGAIILALVAWSRPPSAAGSGNWLSGLALFIYAAGFSFAYVILPASTGSLLLFGSVQATMILYGAVSGERLRAAQIIGLLLAVTGLVILFLGKLAAPSLGGSLLMAAAGIAWGVYSLRGNGAGDPVKVTAGNFLRAAPMSIGLSVLLLPAGVFSWDIQGLLCAVCSGAITSGLGYIIWYAALPSLRPTSAATAQLSVPILTAIGAILFLGETLTTTLLVAAAAVLGGIVLINLGKSPPKIGSIGRKPG